MPDKIMLFTLETFKSTGGIQNMTRTMAYSINHLSQEHKKQFQMWSVYDDGDDLKTNYIPAENFRAFAGNKSSFFIGLFKNLRWPDLAIISHINLAIVGLLLKIFNPKAKVWLVVHGIEVWQHLSPIKRALLKRCDKIICVSNFTKSKLMQLHKVREVKCVVLNNTLDPFFTPPQQFKKPSYLQQRYQLDDKNPVLLTLTRIHQAEQYKGYDKVIEALVGLKQEFPGVKYLLAGKSDAIEKNRIENLIAQNNLQDNVIITGFIDERELIDHFSLADLFVMPSTGEGFGLVLIEATACGTPVICGNADGSVDAIRNGELGEAVDVENESMLRDAIAGQLRAGPSETKRKYLQSKCLQHFSAVNYQNLLNHLIFNE